MWYPLNVIFSWIHPQYCHPHPTKYVSSICFLPLLPADLRQRLPEKKRSSCFLFGGCKPGPFRKLDGQNRTRNTEFIRYRRITTWIHLDPFIHLDLVGHVFFPTTSNNPLKIRFLSRCSQLHKKITGFSQCKPGDPANQAGWHRRNTIGCWSVL